MSALNLSTEAWRTVTDSEFEVRMSKRVHAGGPMCAIRASRAVSPSTIIPAHRTAPSSLSSRRGLCSSMHLSVLQALASYFTGDSLGEALNSSIPHHTVLQLTPSPHTMMWERAYPTTKDERDDAAGRALRETPKMYYLRRAWRRLVARDPIRDADMLTVSMMASPKMHARETPSHSSGNASVAMGAAGVCLEALCGCRVYHH